MVFMPPLLKQNKKNPTTIFFLTAHLGKIDLLLWCFIYLWPYIVVEKSYDVTQCNSKHSCVQDLFSVFILKPGTFAFFCFITVK